jgi:hypothetical protein
MLAEEFTSLVDDELMPLFTTRVHPKLNALLLGAWTSLLRTHVIRILVADVAIGFMSPADRAYSLMHALIRVHMSTSGCIPIENDDGARVRMLAHIHSRPLPSPPSTVAAFTAIVQTREAFAAEALVKPVEHFDATLPVFWITFATLVGPQRVLFETARANIVCPESAACIELDITPDAVAAHPCHLVTDETAYIFVCAQCGAIDENDTRLLVCGRCCSTRYCSVECQRAHRVRHAPLCQPPACSCAERMNASPPLLR